MRRRRNEVTVELRKNKREETLQKRRNVPVADSTDEDDIEKSMSNINLEDLVRDASNSKNPQVCECRKKIIRCLLFFHVLLYKC